MAAEGKPEKKRRIAKKPRTTVPPRSKEAQSKGGKNLSKKLHEIAQTYDAIVRPEADYGFVPGISDTGLHSGDLRNDVVYELPYGKIGVLSDAHWPFHDLQRTADGQFHGSYITALSFLKDAGIDSLVLNGDMMDLFHLSAHEKIEAKRNWKWELDVSKAMLKHLREFFGDKVRIVYREGNHEERFKRYLAKKAEVLQDTIYLQEFLGLRDLNIDWVEDRAKMTAGKLYIDHGHEYYGGGAVNPSRSYFLKAYDSILIGHVHKKSDTIVRRPLDGSYFQASTVGCLCDLNPRYAPRNQWTHGFAIIEVGKDREFTLHNKMIVNGKVI
jgi:predicted phosphodiesterase